MNEALIAVVSVLIGIALCILGVFCYFMLRNMSKLQEAITQASVSSKESAAEAKAIVNQAKEMFGETGPVARSAKAITKLTDQIPEVLGGLRVFNETFSPIAKLAFMPQKTASPQPQPNTVDDSQFIPYSEEAAAQFEAERRAKANVLDLPDDVLASMRTDTEPPPEPPTSSPES